MKASRQLKLWALYSLERTPVHIEWEAG